jgi:hypothetical protein
MKRLAVLSVLALAACASPNEGNSESGLTAPAVDVCQEVHAFAAAKVKTVTVVPYLTIDSGVSGELVHCLPTTWEHGYVYVPVYAVRLHGLHKGDVLLVTAEMQVTNDTGVNVMLDTQLTLGALDFQDPNLLRITSHNGFNVTPGMHHGTSHKNAAVIMTRSYDDAYLVLWAWAATNGLPAASLTVDQNYGRIQGIVLRGGSQ